MRESGLQMQKQKSKDGKKGKTMMADAATSEDMKCAVAQVTQRVESAIFGAAELAKEALIPCFTWLGAALQTPGKPWSSRVAPFQGGARS